MYLLTFCIMLP